jgi:thiol-disulfide isomerase/thioredoxin
MPSARKSLLLLLSVALGCCAAMTTPASTPPEYKVDQILPNATLQGINGRSRQLSDFRGKPLLINVWASWCGPCRQEMASLERLAWGELGQQINIIGISTDDYAQRAKDWLAQSHSTINQFIDTRLQMENMLGASRLPLTVLVSSNGRILSKIYGARDWDSPQSLQQLRKQFAL